MQHKSNIFYETNMFWFWKICTK